MLDSTTEYSTILSGVVDALDKAMKERREKVDVAGRLELLEERLEKLELILRRKKLC